MQQPSTNIRLVAAGLLGGASVFMAIYGNSRTFVAKSDMIAQRAYTIGNLYQMVHVIAIAITGVTAAKAKGKPACDLAIASLCFAVGTVVLSSTRYIQCLAAPKANWLMRITQFGGAVTAVGWGFLVAAAVRGAKA